MLDLAAGTGKLTRQLVPRFARVVAVEPLDGHACACWSASCRTRRRSSGSADAIPLEDDAVDAVFVAEAFHWFANAATLAELARVLRPRGTLAILFNHADRDFDPPLPEAFWEAYRAAAIEKPPELTVSSGSGRRPSRGRSSPSSRRASRTRSSSTGRRSWRRPSSWSMIAALPEAERAALLARLGELLPEGVYRHPLRTELYRTRLR